MRNFEQAVVDGYANTYAIWLKAEADIPSDLEWQFGFRIPKALLEAHMASVTNPKKRRSKEVSQSTMQQDRIEQIHPVLTQD